MMTEGEICVWMERQIRMGEYRRRNPEKIAIGDHPSTVRGYLQVLGWVKEDLRLALIKADPTYAANQAALRKIPPTCKDPAEPLNIGESNGTA